MNNVIEYTYLIEYFKKYSMTDAVSTQIIVIRIKSNDFSLPNLTRNLLQ